MRGAGGEGTGLGTGPAAIWDRTRSATRWCWVTAFRPYPADAPRMTATADAVISLRGCCRAPRAWGLPGWSAPAGDGSDRGFIADWAAVTPASSSAAVGRL